MKRSIFIIPLLAMLASCGTQTDATSSIPPKPEPSETEQVDHYDVKWATPHGAPTLAFFDQGQNANWLSSSNPAKDVLPHFADNAYDALVFDGTQALTNIKMNKRNYALAKWISGGTFYVVSTKHQAGALHQSMPRVYSFMNQGNVSKAFRKLASDAWKWGTYADKTDEHVTYGKSVADVQGALSAMLKAGSVEGDPYDYYLLADPAYSALSAKFKKAGLPLHTVYDIQAEFKKAFQADVPAAAIFVNKDSYAAHPKAIASWLDQTSAAMEKVATDLSLVIPEVKKLDSADGSSNPKFGLSSAALGLVAKRAGANMNPFNYRVELKTKEANAKYANDFQTALGQPAFDNSLFL